MRTILTMIHRIDCSKESTGTENNSYEVNVWKAVKQFSLASCQRAGALRLSIEAMVLSGSQSTRFFKVVSLMSSHAAVNNYFKSSVDSQCRTRLYASVSSMPQKFSIKLCSGDRAGHANTSVFVSWKNFFYTKFHGSSHYLAAVLLL